MNIPFPTSIDTSLIENSVLNLANENVILWRKSEKDIEDHFLLKEGQEDTSFFRLNRELNIEDNGFNFLLFFFCYPVAGVFYYKQNEFKTSRSVSLYTRKLLTQIRSSVTLKKKLLDLKVSESDKYDHKATHYGLFFDKDEQGNYFDIDPDVKIALKKSSKLNPEEQDEKFIGDIISKSNEFLFKKNFVILISKLSIFQATPNAKIRKEIKSYRKIISKILDYDNDLLTLIYNDLKEICLKQQISWDITDEILSRDFYPV